VPYKSNPAPDVMSGVVSLSLEASTTAIPSIQANRVKALAISGAERIPSLPNVPTMTEFNPSLDPNGVIGNSWHGLFTPAGTPDDIVNRLNVELVKIVKTDDVQTRLRTRTGHQGGVGAGGVIVESADPRRRGCRMSHS
jgi:tripartite-type tricarboxylate transporter receptor subunit TctC